MKLKLGEERYGFRLMKAMTVLVVTSPDEPKEGDFIVYPLSYTVPVKYMGGDLSGNEMKVIFSEFPLEGVLPIEDGTDVRAIAFDHTQKTQNVTEHPLESRIKAEWFKKGYEYAKSLMFSEDQLIEAMSFAEFHIMMEDRPLFLKRNSEPTKDYHDFVEQLRLPTVEIQFEKGLPARAFLL